MTEPYDPSEDDAPDDETPLLDLDLSKLPKAEAESYTSLVDKLRRVGELAGIKDLDAIEAFASLERATAATRDALREELARIRKRAAEIERIIGPQEPPAPPAEDPTKPARQKVMPTLLAGLAVLQAGSDVDVELAVGIAPGASRSSLSHALKAAAKRGYLEASAKRGAYTRTDKEIPRASE